MINRYEVEVTLTKKVRFTTEQTEKQLNYIFDEAEDYADDFDRVDRKSTRLNSSHS